MLFRAGCLLGNDALNALDWLFLPQLFVRHRWPEMLLLLQEQLFQLVYFLLNPSNSFRISHWIHILRQLLVHRQHNEIVNFVQNYPNLLKVVFSRS